MANISEMVFYFKIKSPLRHQQTDFTRKNDKLTVKKKYFLEKLSNLINNSCQK